MRNETKRKGFTYACMLILVITIAASIGSFAQISQGQSTSQWTLQVSASNPNTTQTITSFAPFDLVQIKANLSYANAAQDNAEVVFKVVGPANASNPTTIVRTALTDQSGIANITFRLPSGNTAETPTIGIWSVNCTGGLLNQTVQGNTAFKVDWPISIQNIKLTDQNGTETNSFSQGETFRAQIDLSNNGSQTINATLITNITDPSGTQINIFTRNLTMGSFQTSAAEGEFSISDSCPLGEAKLDCTVVSIVQGQSVWYSLSKNFSVTEGSNSNSTDQQPTNETEPSTDYHDLALTEAGLSTTQAERGQTVNVTVTALNRGNSSEQSTIHITYGHSEAGSIQIQLAGNEQKDLKYQWDTSNVTLGSYLITVHVDAVDGENQTSDNDKNAGTITIKAPQPSIIPTLSATSLYVIALFIVGLTTFSLLSYLKWIRVKPPMVKAPLTFAAQEEQGGEIKTPAIPMPQVLPTPLVAPSFKAPMVMSQKVATEVKVSGDLSDELAQLKLQSLELLPLSTRSIELSIQKIQLLQASNATKEQLEYELADLDKIVDLQTNSMEKEISILKESLQKVRALSKSSYANQSPQKVDSQEVKPQPTENQEQQNAADQEQPKASESTNTQENA